MTETHPDAGEPSNKQRAAWAEAALDAFAQDVYCDRRFADLPSDEEAPHFGDDFTCVQDLIGNLLHVAKIKGWDVDQLLKFAREGFEEEILLELEPGLPPTVARALRDGSLPPLWPPAQGEPDAGSLPPLGAPSLVERNALTVDVAGYLRDGVLEAVVAFLDTRSDVRMGVRVGGHDGGYIRLHCFRQEAVDAVDAFLAANGLRRYPAR